MIFLTKCSQVEVFGGLVDFFLTAIIIAGFLSKDMTYSCGIFEELDADIRHGTDGRGKWSGGHGLTRFGPRTLTGQVEPTPTAPATAGDELYDAQIRKLNHIIKKARILPGHRVLEIGTGWGSLAILIVSTIPNTRIDTITLSTQQRNLAIERIEALGLQDRITVHLMDYRNMPWEWGGAFDRVVSIEMMEAVGANFLEKYWSILDWAMKKIGGAGVVQVITIPEPSKLSRTFNLTIVHCAIGFERYIREVDFIRKWVRYLSTVFSALRTE